MDCRKLGHRCMQSFRVCIKNICERFVHLFELYWGYILTPLSKLKTYIFHSYLVLHRVYTFMWVLFGVCGKVFHGVLGAKLWST